MTALRRRSFPASPGGGGGAAAPEGGRRAAAAARPASARDSPLYPLCYAGRAPQRPATSPTTPGMAASRRCFSLASPGGGGGAAAPEGGRSVRRHNTPRLRARFPPRPSAASPHPPRPAPPQNGRLAQTLFPLASPQRGRWGRSPEREHAPGMAALRRRFSPLPPPAGEVGPQPRKGAAGPPSQHVPPPHEISRCASRAVPAAHAVPVRIPRCARPHPRRTRPRPRHPIGISRRARSAKRSPGIRPGIALVPMFRPLFRPLFKPCPCCRRAWPSPADCPRSCDAAPRGGGGA